MVGVHFAIFLFVFSIYSMQSFVIRSFQKQPKLIRRIAKLQSVYGLPKFEPQQLSPEEIKNMGHPLLLPFTDLALLVGGNGKAKTIWDHLRNGVDPLTTDDEAFDADPYSNLSAKAKAVVREALNGRPMIPGEVVEEKVSECGTRKLLIKMIDNQSIEIVLIPSPKYGRTTLCVSSQIGIVCKHCYSRCHYLYRM